MATALPQTPRPAPPKDAAHPRPTPQKGVVFSDWASI